MAKRKANAAGVDSPAAEGGNGRRRPVRTLDSRLRERLLVLLICLAGGLRIFVISAAFPFFNNVDEIPHFDLVLKYARGHMPVELEPAERETAAAQVMFNTFEYTFSPFQFPTGEYPPPSMVGQADQMELMLWDQIGAVQKNLDSYESTQPPIYYAAAGLWYRLGKALGLGRPAVLYWVRFLGIPIYMLLVWLAYLFAVNVYPGRPFLRLGAPLLVAFFPQTIFAAVNNDVPSALLAGAALYGLFRIYTSDVSSYRLYVLAGLFTAAAFLTKLTNFAVFAVLAVVVVGLIIRWKREGILKSRIPRAAALLACAAVPVLLWMVRNVLVGLDIVASRPKVHDLGWTLKPFAETWDHPLFGTAALTHFVYPLMASFWRGEYVWHGERLKIEGTDLFFAISSVLFVLIAVVAAFLYRKRAASGEFSADCLNLLAFGLGVAMLAAMSLAYDFGQCDYPSASEPFLVSGRLLLGGLIPFVMLYLTGMDRVLGWLKLGRYRYVALGLMLLVPVVHQVVILAGPVQSEWNWFHMVWGH